MHLTDYPLLRTLTQWPHRGAGTAYGREAAQLLSDELTKLGFEVTLQPFATPATYVSIVYWLIGGLLAGLTLASWWGAWALGITVFFALNALLYFDWRPSWCLYFPPLVKAHNVIGKQPRADSTKPTLVLMAHYDSAPVSALYQKQSKNGFRNTLRISMGVILLSMPIVVLTVMYPDNLYILILRVLLAVYLIGQAFLGTVGFWQNGYTNGASDNATGVVAAIQTAQLLKDTLQNTAVEVVLTSAEEPGMIGAYHYYRQAQRHPQKRFVINFDTLGAGSLKIITQTGSMTTMRYDNILTQTALQAANENPQLTHVETGSWHTADFDSAWFVRGGVPSMTLAALDSEGLMPRIHRTEDTLEHVDLAPMQEAILLATAVGKHLDNL